jgi:hypothetical protein
MPIKKRQLYEQLIERMDNAFAAGYFLEASWYAYSLLEDRLNSLLKNTGGLPTGNNGHPIMMGKKISQLKKRAHTYDELEKLDLSSLGIWAKDRNDLMHAMADASKTMEAISSSVKKLANVGVPMVRDFAKIAMKIKKQNKARGKRQRTAAKK